MLLAAGFVPEAADERDAAEEDGGGRDEGDEDEVGEPAEEERELAEGRSAGLRSGRWSVEDWVGSGTGVGSSGLGDASDETQVLRLRLCAPLRMTHCF